MLNQSSLAGRNLAQALLRQQVIPNANTAPDAADFWCGFLSAVVGGAHVAIGAPALLQTLNTLGTAIELAEASTIGSAP